MDADDAVRSGFTARQIGMICVALADLSTFTQSGRIAGLARGHVYALISMIIPGGTRDAATGGAMGGRSGSWQQAASVGSRGQPRQIARKACAKQQGCSVDGDLASCQDLPTKGRGNSRYPRNAPTGAGSVLPVYPWLPAPREASAWQMAGGCDAWSDARLRARPASPG